MNGASARNGYDYDAGRRPPPRGKPLAERYRRDVLPASEEKRLYNNSVRPPPRRLTIPSYSLSRVFV
jgi:hypothetical protein